MAEAEATAATTGIATHVVGGKVGWVEEANDTASFGSLKC